MQGNLWNRREPPVLNSHDAFVHLEVNETLTIDRHVTIESLVLSGTGTVALTGSDASLTILSSFSWLGADISGTAGAGDSVVNLYGSSVKCSLTSTYLKYVKISNFGNFTFSCGNFVVDHAVLTNEERGIMLVNTTSSNPLAVERDVAEIFYEGYPGYILNVDANLRYTYPPGEAVFDVVSPDVVYIRETPSAQHLYPLLVSGDIASQRFYHLAGAAGLNAFNGTMYDEVALNVEVTGCAKLCRVRTWCKSFDFYKYKSICYLSRFTSSMVGGLTAIEGNDIDTYAVHYNMKAFRNSIVYDDPVAIAALNAIAIDPMGSHLKNEGELFISGSGVFSLDIPMVSNATGATVINSSELILHLGGTIGSGSSINVEGGWLTVDGVEDTAFAAEPGSEIRSTINNSTIEFSGSSNTLSGYIRDVNIRISNIAVVYMNMDFDVTLESVVVSATAVLVGPKGHALQSLTYIRLLDKAVVISRNTTLICDALEISGTALVNATARGYPGGLGPGAGISAEFNPSGGSYGGIGGSNRFNSSITNIESQYSGAYGSSFFPSDFGSGGGSIADGTRGKAGGGFISLFVRLFTFYLYLCLIHTDSSLM